MFVAFPLLILYVWEEGCVMCLLPFLGNTFRHVRKIVFCVCSVYLFITLDV